MEEKRKKKSKRARDNEIDADNFDGDFWDAIINLLSPHLLTYSLTYLLTYLRQSRRGWAAAYSEEKVSLHFV